MRKETIKKQTSIADKLYEDLNKRLKKTTTFYIVLNLLIYIIAAAIIVLNIFAIRKNTASDDVKWLFVAVSIMTSITSFISSIISLFVYRKKNKKLNEKIKAIKTEKQQYKNRVLEYAVENPEPVLIEKVTRIINS